MSGYYLSEPPPEERGGMPWWERWILQPLALVVAPPFILAWWVLRFVRRRFGLDPETGLGERIYPPPLGPWRP